MARHALLQFRPEKARLRENLSRLAEHLKALRPYAPEVVVLPEAALTGYFLQGGVRELALTRFELLELLSGVYQQAGWEDLGLLDLVVGFYERDEGAYYNSAAYLELPHRIVHVHRKVFLPTYGVFDEERYLARGRRVEAFPTRFGRAAILICEDFWHSVTAAIAALDGAEVIYVPSASPARGFQGERPENVERWRTLARAVAAEHGLYVILASLVGFEAGKGMSGGSLVVGPEGRILAEAPLFEEAALLFHLDRERIPPVRYDSPLLSDLEAGLPLLLPDLKRVLNGRQHADS
ncbi:MAG: beta-ureidopropionase [Thermus sp.]|uniref:nitrilase-related carbon-nitrogen hydrolase n=1 Tax=unclassified Thermus TaxID=2619321 RepID=UPI000238929F|nr:MULTISPECIES: nitrilase-related carbon-nitrogen hydrolase [unclassified Thermus]AEV17137.1 Beta-ureidopropionase [Thermus sp. CCB_US3_UF1]MCS6867616.1 beta-ureidopropionase [Thermus sp.]MCS7217733.1 beta-ureidopropionase [Thermus sp.]MCX7849521.1 beta-ureidopropionase [Thermus sp.]MDW8016549.1 nitrilase-related carbon-nitrogen hydrolase [Thermus sp.]